MDEPPVLLMCTELSRRLPPATSHPQLVWNPRRRALTLIGQHNNTCVAWEWTPRGFAASIDGFFDEATVGARVGEVFAFTDLDLDDVVVVGVLDHGLITAPLSRVADPTSFERFAAKCQPSQGRLFAAWVKPGEVWLHLPGNHAAVYALVGAAGARSLARIADAPESLVSWGFDDKSQELLAVSVTGHLMRFDGRAWHACGTARSDGSMATHPELGVVMLQHDPEGGGLELVRRDGDRFVSVRPKRAAPHYVSGFSVGIDRNDDAVVFHGGQDFEKGGGALTNASFSSTGAGAPFVPPGDPWRVDIGRYNDAFTVNGALVIATHGERLATFAFGAEGVTRAELRRVDPSAAYDGDLDDRYIHITGDARGTFVFDAKGAVRLAPPGGTLAPLVDKPAKGQGPRSAYAHRTAVTVDEDGRLLVHGPETASETWRLENAQWRRITSKQKPPRGNTGFVSTPAGVYAFVNGQLWLLRDDEWSKLATDETFRSRVLLAHRDKRRLIAVSHRIVAAYDDATRRFVPIAELPEDFNVPPHTNNNTDVVGVDQARDRLIAANEDVVVALSLPSLAAAEAWPTTAARPTKRRKPSTIDPSD